MSRLSMFVVFALVAACGDDDTSPCTPGMSTTCECPTGDGVRTCGADGAFEGCMCPQMDAGRTLDAQVSDVESTPDVGVDSGPTDSGGPDVPVIMDDNCDDGTCVFVTRMFDIPGISEEGAAYGENLDEVVTRPGDTTGCGQRDYRSRLDDTQGVDNAILTLLPVIDGMSAVGLSQVYANALVENELLMVIKLEDVDGADDENVGVSLWYGRIVGTPTFDDDGLVDGGQTITAVSPVSTTTGAIAEGRFRAVFPEVPFSIGLLSDLTFLPLVDARVSANIDVTTLREGMIAGAFDLEALAEAMAMSPQINSTQARDLLQAFADMEPADGMCQALSVGASFESVHARED